MPGKHIPPGAASRLRRQGRLEALVTLIGPAAKKRRGCCWGEYGSPAGRQLCHRVLAERPAQVVPGRPRPDHRRAVRRAGQI